MMRIYDAILLLGILCTVSGSSLSTPVPLFVWSQKEYFNNDAPSGDVIKLPQVSQIFQEILAQTKPKASQLKRYLSNSQLRPEAVVAFVFPEMGSAQYTRTKDSTNVATAMDASTSFLSLPYVMTQGQKISDVLVSILHQTVPTAQVIRSTLDTSNTQTDCDALMSKLRAESNVFYNGQPDIVLVHTTDQSACMKLVIEFVNSKTKGNFISLVSSDNAANKVEMDFASPEVHAYRLAATSRKAQADNRYAQESLIQAQAQTQGMTTQATTTSLSAIGYPGPQFITPAIVAGLFLAFFLLFILWVGIYSLMAIERPIRFSHVTLKMGKEY